MGASYTTYQIKSLKLWSWTAFLQPFQDLTPVPYSHVNVGPCQHGIACPWVAGRKWLPDMDGSCEYT